MEHLSIAQLHKRWRNRIEWNGVKVKAKNAKARGSRSVGHSAGAPKTKVRYAVCSRNGINRRGIRANTPKTGTPTNLRYGQVVLRGTLAVAVPCASSLALSRARAHEHWRPRGRSGTGSSARDAKVTPKRDGNGMAQDRRDTARGSRAVPSPLARLRASHGPRGWCGGLITTCKGWNRGTRHGRVVGLDGESSGRSGGEESDVSAALSGGLAPPCRFFAVPAPQRRGRHHHPRYHFIHFVSHDTSTYTPTATASINKRPCFLVARLNYYPGVRVSDVQRNN